MIGIGVIGYGYWGPNLVRNFATTPDARVIAVCDLDQQRRDLAALRHPGIETTDNPRALLENRAVDAVAIATPVASHFELALQALKAGRHVLVEKPLTQSSEQGQRLIEAAERAGKTLMVDHTFIYTGAVRKIRELIEGGEIGEVLYYDSTRVNLGLFQSDVSVLWDLAVHDLAIMDYLMPEEPRAVSATAIAHVHGQPENTAYLTVFYSGNRIAHVNVNWLAPVKLRQTLIGGDKKMIVYDDLEPSEKIKIYDKGIELNGDLETRRNIFINYRTGEMRAPTFDRAEALAVEAKHFVECVQTGKTPLTDGRAGLRVVRILEAAAGSIAAHGQMVEL